MFELVLKSSKDVKKLVVEFGEDSVTSSVDSVSNNLDEIAEPKLPAKSATDLIAERAAKAVSTAPAKEKTVAQLPVVDENRTPNVDNSFTESF